MKKTLKRLCTGFLALATVVTALPSTPVHAESKQYWTESKERVGIVKKVSPLLLLINKAGMTFRLQGDFSKAELIRMAESVKAGD